MALNVVVKVRLSVFLSPDVYNGSYSLCYPQQQEKKPFFFCWLLLRESVFCVAASNPEVYFVSVVEDKASEPSAAPQ